mgnify:CR=1 FL=1
MSLANDLVLGKHAEALALAAKQYTLAELLTLSQAIALELDACSINLFDADDWAFVFAQGFSNNDVDYVFAQAGDSPSVLPADDVNFIFDNQAAAQEVFSASEINYIFL